VKNAGHGGIMVQTTEGRVNSSEGARLSVGWSHKDGPWLLQEVTTLSTEGRLSISTTIP
jgi:hypothetical protein